ncbi:hypothetical protein FACS1894170_13370 [Planctomycetales bacterium]|nr:hypothetical protein FACS1894170_13370 [Planctomycetales bacterium]
MLSYPTIHVENFARIRNADIEIAPLTLFVGDNNSGKTYLSSLIWGIDGFLDGKFSIEQNYGQEFQNLLDWIENSCSEIKEEGSVSDAVSEQFHKAIVGFINQHLSVRKEDCVRGIFGSNVGIKHLALEVPFDCTKNVSFGIRRINRESVDADLPLFIFDIHINGKPQLFSQRRLLRFHSSKYVLRTLIRLYYQNIWKSAVYIPASRAGLLLTRRSVLDDSLESRFPRHKMRNKDYQLTQPQVEFVRLLLWLSKEQRRKMLWVPCDDQAMSKIVDFIEYRILNGRIDLSETPVADILYYPQNSKEPLAMQLVSGVVSEIAPFLSCLKFGKKRSISNTGNFAVNVHLILSTIY